MEGNGLKRLVSDPAIYVWGGKGGKVIVPIFVDDIQIATKSTKRAQEVLAKAFKITDLGPTQFLLGIHITRDRARRTMHLSQRQYVIDLLERFGMADCAPNETPMDPGLKLSTEDSPSNDEEEHEMKGVPYATAVGALNYAAVATRPDISLAIHRLSRYLHNPGPRHWKAVKHLLRYLQGTKDLRLTYAPDPFVPMSQHLFTAFTDSDFAGDRDSGRSTNGYIIKMGTGAVAWASKLQGPVAKSSTEAEFYGASFAGTEIKWLKHFLGEIGFDVSKPTPLHVDNMSTIQVLNDAVHHSRMKHIPVQEFWIRNEIVNEKTIQPVYQDTQHLCADMMTKALSRIYVNRHRATMGLL